MATRADAKNNELPGPIRKGLREPAIVLGGLLLATIAWATWPILADAAHRWSHDPRYSHGYLVPAFAAYLLWLRRGLLGPFPYRPAWWGLLVLGSGVGLYLTGGFYHVRWFEGLSLLGMLAGLVILAGGMRALRWAWPSIGFLVFMLPLPYRIEVGLGGQLQWIATRMSTFALQTLGLPAISEGNVIHLSDGFSLGVVEACSGLGMLVTFFATTTGVALLVRRPLVDRIIIVLSAVPIALAANVIRITATGLLHETVGSRLAHVVYHDLAGWLMMPLAIGLLYLEMLLLAHLFIECEPPGTLAFEFVETAGRCGSGDALRRPVRSSGPRG